MATRSKASRTRNSLSTYRQKRDFAVTAEPRGTQEKPRRRRALAFVIQKHAATRLHFDLRLELDGVMKSWAVPKGPSRDPAAKRFAKQVEDHPIEYNEFEGTIPKGEYGGGTVVIWDRGTYEPEGTVDELREGLAKGKITFTLRGERLQGSWALVRMHGKGDDWLLIKHKDEFVVPDDDLAAENTSVVTGRSIDDVTNGKGPKRVWRSNRDSSSENGRRSRRVATAEAPSESKKASATEAPLTPMLATVADDVPTGDGWAYEPKYDGIRVLAFVDRDAVSLVTRNGIDRARQFPEVVESLRALSLSGPRAFVLDGEIVGMKGETFARFQALQRRVGETNPTKIAAHRTSAPAAYVVFDLLLAESEILVREPWTTRRERLERLLGKKPPGVLRLGEAQIGNADALIDRARRAHWEGVMAKRTDSAYTPGERTRHWRKLKLEMRQELVVGGWTRPRKTRKHFGALLLGYWDGDRFVYAGHTGTGFTRDDLAELSRRLERIERSTSPFDDPPVPNEPAHWVRPEIVVEIKFNEWTNDGKLRQPVFVGVREDKDPRAVSREPTSLQSPADEVPDGAPADSEADETPMRTRTTKRATKKTAKRKSSEAKRSRGRPATVGRPAAARLSDAVAAQLAEIEASGGKGRVELGRGKTLDVTNLDKVYFPESGHTKGDVMRYYVEAAPIILPLIQDRPLVLKRHPEGIGAAAFFQQAPPDETPASVRVDTVPVADGGRARRLLGGDLATLLYGVQLGAIAVDPWHSRCQSLEHPDYAVLDLDPGPKAPFEQIVAVARWLRELLDEAKLGAAVKTSGSRGLHIYIPLPARTTNETAQLVAELLAEHVATQHPKEATTKRSKSARPESAVYVDFMQNVVGKSVAAPFSVRAKPGATVSTPLGWDELVDDLDPHAFTIDTLTGRELRRRGRIWTDGMRHKNAFDSLLPRKGRRR